PPRAFAPILTGALAVQNSRPARRSSRALADAKLGAALCTAVVSDESVDFPWSGYETAGTSARALRSRPARSGLEQPRSSHHRDATTRPIALMLRAVGPKPARSGLGTFDYRSEALC